MNTANVLSLIEQLEDNIDDLEDDLEPLTSTALAASTKKLPLLDKAKLYVVVVYAIESLLFSYMKLHGVAAKEHPVFLELTRVKQYFEKIKSAEEGGSQTPKTLSLNKQAAGRIIKHALAGNDKYDLERAEREAREKFLARRKLIQLEKKMQEKAGSQEKPNVGEVLQLADFITNQDQKISGGDIIGAGSPVSEVAAVSDGSMLGAETSEETTATDEAVDVPAESPEAMNGIEDSNKTIVEKQAPDTQGKKRKRKIAEAETASKEQDKPKKLKQETAKKLTKAQKKAAKKAKQAEVAAQQQSTSEQQTQPVVQRRRAITVAQKAEPKAQNQVQATAKVGKNAAKKARKRARAEAAANAHVKASNGTDAEAG